MRDVQRAMTKLYDAAIAAGLSADDATMAIGAMHERYGPGLVSLYSDDDITEMTLNEGVQIAAGLAGMTLPVDAEPIETEGETDGRTE